MTEKQMSFSQSLFQVYFLGSLEVDRRCSSNVMPWLIEELKQELKNMNLVWITLGPANIEYVADSGEELYAHAYNSILRWETGVDNISVAYITSIGDKSHCHVFQCLDLDEASKIILLFKSHCTSVDVNQNPIQMPGDKLATLVQANKKRSKSLSGHTTVVLPVTYCGKINIKLKKVTAETVDDIVSCLAIKDRPTSAKKYKKWRKKRRSIQMSAPLTNSLYRVTSAGDDEAVSNDTASDCAVNIEDQEETLGITSVHSLSCLDVVAHETVSAARPRAISDISPTKSLIIVPTTTAKAPLTKTDSDSGGRRKKRSWIFGTLRKGRSSSSLDNIYHPVPSTNEEDEVSPALMLKEDQPNQESDNEGKQEDHLIRSLTAPTPATRLVDSLDSSTEPDDIDGEVDEDEFDVLPDLQQLQQEPEFASLGVEGIIRSIRGHLSISKACMFSLSATNLQITQQFNESSLNEYSQMSSMEQETLFSCGVRHILGCAQGSMSNEYIGFITREKNSPIRQFHLLKAASVKVAANLIKCFKNCFDSYMIISFPNTLCETCPIYFLNSICKKLNDLSLTDAQSQIHQLMLLYLTESEYSSLAKQFRKDSFANEHTQLVQWVVLLQTFFHRRQKSHTHHSIKESKKTIGRKGKKLLGLKDITGSYDNLRDRLTSLKSENIGLQSSSATDIGRMSSSSNQLESINNSASPMLSPTINVENDDNMTSASRDGSGCTTPELAQKRLSASLTFPPRELQLSPASKKILQIKATNSRQRTDSGAILKSISPVADSGNVSPTGRSPFKKGHQRSMSWRQQIFESVTPSKNAESARRRPSIKEIMEYSGHNNISQRISFTESISETEEEDPSARARRRWQWAIEQQLLLVRLEKENQSVMRDTLRRYKLNYADPAVDNEVMGKVWLDLIEEGHPSTESLLAAVKMGVPPKLRERVWALLMSHYQSLHPGEVPSGSYKSSVSKQEYEQLYKQQTEYEPVISVDIGRTYPNHPYFSSQYKYGRLSLYNVLRAYAVSDPDIGYCQGLSFVAGLILLHSSSEVEAFQLLNHFMHVYSYRDIYSQDMYILQIKLYQFSRLLHDHLPTLHSHLEEHDVTPFLYAAPWFLTLFSSQFPISFVARIMDLILYEGISAIFKVGIAILTHYQFEILELNHMETITDFLKTTIPEKVTDSVSEILHTSTQISNISIKLKTFETEYHVMHELMATFHMKQSSSIDMETMNEMLRKQNKDLIEQLAVCRGAIMRLEKAVETCNTRIDKQQQMIKVLEDERKMRESQKSLCVDKGIQTAQELSVGDVDCQVFSDDNNLSHNQDFSIYPTSTVNDENQ